MDAGESLRELEQRCGVARGNLSQIETGKRVPSTREIVALEQAYGLELAVRVQLVETTPAKITPAGPVEPPHRGMCVNHHCRRFEYVVATVEGGTCEECGRMLLGPDGVNYPGDAARRTV